MRANTSRELHHTLSTDKQHYTSKVINFATKRPSVGKFEFQVKLKPGWGVGKRKQEEKSHPSPALDRAGGVDPEEHVVTSREVDNVGRPGECGGDLARSLDAAELEETSARSSGSIGDELGSLTLTLGADDGSAPLLLCTGDQEFGSLGFLLSHLLLLNGAGELDTVGEVGDGHVIKHDVEVAGAADEGIADEGRDVRPLGEQLVGIELGDDGFKDLVADGREDLLVVLGAKGCEDGGKASDVGAGEEAEGEVAICRSLVPELERDAFSSVALTPRPIAARATFVRNDTAACPPPAAICLS
ncbi:hypothetical protein GW17_00049525 [Ensete ventricosum]|nr:hypothetical protein GW17_00049525 [Ensete ventricosum]